MGSATMVRWTRHARVSVKNCAVVAVAGTLAVGAVSIPVAPAHATDPITAVYDLFIAWLNDSRYRCRLYPRVPELWCRAGGVSHRISDDSGTSW